MKYEAQAKGAVKVLVAASMMAFLAACGGGGGSSANSGTNSGSGISTGTGSTGTSSTGTGSTGTGSAGPGSTTTRNATDPYTQQPATGTPTQQVTGSVTSGLTVGATVTAYALNADGSNGDAIGSAVTDANGSFSMTLTQAPSGMVRFVATGGTFASEADNSTQKNTTLELVTPYVTTTLSNFVITPLTYYASQRISYLVSIGKTLLIAYTTASSAALQVITGNEVIASANRTHGGVDYLSIQPGTAHDTLNAYLDALTGLEYFAVKHDLPSHTAVRVLVQTAVPGLNGTNDVNGQPVNVGQWSNGIFDETLPYTAATMQGGADVASDVAAIVQQLNAVQACASGDHSTYYQKFPLPAGQSDYLDASTCAAYTNNINAIKAKTTTNNRSKFVS